MVGERTDSQGAADVTQAAVDGLIYELRKSVEKLRDSNRQLEAAIEAGDRDPELRAAIGVCSRATVRHTQDHPGSGSEAPSAAQRIATRPVKFPV